MVVHVLWLVVGGGVNDLAHALKPEGSALDATLTPIEAEAVLMFETQF